jgi:hypothetical protein
MTEEQKAETIKRLWDELMELKNDMELIFAESQRLKELHTQKLQRMLWIKREFEVLTGRRGKG